MNNITILCPTCKKERFVPIESYDVKGAALCEILCNDCWVPGNKCEEVMYYDKNGRELTNFIDS